MTCMQTWACAKICFLNTNLTILQFFCFSCIVSLFMAFWRILCTTMPFSIFPILTDLNAYHIVCILAHFYAHDFLTREICLHNKIWVHDYFDRYEIKDSIAVVLDKIQTIKYGFQTVNIVGWIIKIGNIYKDIQ